MFKIHLSSSVGPSFCKAMPILMDSQQVGIHKCVNGWVLEYLSAHGWGRRKHSAPERTQPYKNCPVSHKGHILWATLLQCRRLSLRADKGTAHVLPTAWSEKYFASLREEVDQHIFISIYNETGATLIMWVQIGYTEQGKS